MSDEMDRLEQALKAAKPSTNADRKAEILAMAQKSFEASQETAAQPRPIHKSAQNVSGIWTGVKDMFRSINLRPMLYATTAICIGGLAFVTTKPYLDGQGYTPVVIENVGTVSVDDDRTRVDPEAGAEILKDSPRQETERVQEENFATLPETREKEEIAKANKPVAGQIASTEADQLGRLIKKAPEPKRRVDQNKQDFAAVTSGVIAAAPQSVVSGKISPVVQDEQYIQPESHETFSNEAPNPLKIVTDDPVSTFSIDVDTAAYSYARSAILGGYLPAAEAVRIEEMVNYFPYDYATPDLSEAPFSTSVSTFQTPWNPDTKIVHIAIQGAKPDVDSRPPLNLVFLIDTSGSMNAPNKLPLLKQSFRLLLNTLRPTDKIAIVTYAGSAGTVLEPTSASEKDKILASLERLSAGGSTAGQAGLRQAYALAESMQTDNSVGRVLLATDGDFNVGISNPEALKTYVEEKRETGVYLSVFGFGRGNYRDDMMQTLAQNGNGTAAYIDTLSEAQKVMVDQVSGSLFPIANDVKIQVEFNPALVAEYRLIGYETRALKREDFNNDAVDAGEIGAGHTVTALYEITPVGSPAIKNDALRYKQTVATTSDVTEYGFLKLRYKSPGETKSKLITTPISSVSGNPSQEAQFAASIAGFGQLLTKSKYLDGWTWDQNIALANAGKGDDLFGYRAEAVQLMRLAKSLK